MFWIAADHRDEREQKRPNDHEDLENTDPEFCSVSGELQNNSNVPLSPYARTLKTCTANSKASPTEMQMAGDRFGSQYPTRTLRTAYKSELVRVRESERYAPVSSLQTSVNWQIK